MRPPDVKTAPLGRTPPDTALDGSLMQHAAEPSAPVNNTQAHARTQPIKICTACGCEFAPTRTRYRKCRPCALRYKRELVELSRKRNADGCTVFKLLEHLHALRSDDPAARAWLAALIEDKRAE